MAQRPEHTDLRRPRIYFKPNCRRRAVKGVEHIDYRPSKTLPEARAEHKAFQERQAAREGRAATTQSNDWNATVLIDNQRPRSVQIDTFAPTDVKNEAIRLKDKISKLFSDNSTPHRPSQDHAGHKSFVNDAKPFVANHKDFAGSGGSGCSDDDEEGGGDDDQEGFEQASWHELAPNSHPPSSTLLKLAPHLHHTDSSSQSQGNPAVQTKCFECSDFHFLNYYETLFDAEEGAKRPRVNLPNEATEAHIWSEQPGFEGLEIARAKLHQISPLEKIVHWSQSSTPFAFPGPFTIKLPHTLPALRFESPKSYDPLSLAIQIPLLRPVEAPGSRERMSPLGPHSSNALSGAPRLNPKQPGRQSTNLPVERTQTSNGDDDSTQIIVDDQHSVNGKPRSFWFTATASEVSAENHLSSLKIDEQPDWMREGPEETTTIERSHKVKLSNYIYSYPSGAKRSPPSRRISSGSVVNNQRRTKAEAEAEARCHRPGSASQDAKRGASTAQIQILKEAAPELEEGELSPETLTPNTARGSVNTNAESRVKKPELGIYVAPQSRNKHKPTDPSHTGHRPTALEASVTPPPTKTIDALPPHIRMQHRIKKAVTATTSEALVADDKSPNAPSEVKVKSTAKPSSMSNTPDAGIMSDELLGLLKRQGIETIIEPNNSHSTASSCSKRLTAQKFCDTTIPHLKMSTKQPYTENSSHAASQGDRGWLALDVEAIVTKRQNLPHNYDDINKTPFEQEAPVQAHETKFEDLAITTPSSAPAFDWQDRTVDSEKTTTPSPLSCKGKGIVRDDVAQEGTSSPSHVATLDRRITRTQKPDHKTNGMRQSKTGSLTNSLSTPRDRRPRKAQAKPKFGVYDNDDGGVKIEIPDRAEIDDWDGRAPYHNPAERKAQISAFASEQASNIPDQAEVVDVTSPEFTSGRPVLADGEEEVLAEKDRDKQEPRRADPSGHMLPVPQQSTSNDRLQAHMNALKDHPLAGWEVDPLEEMRKLSKAEKRRISSSLKKGPNPHAPKTDIYLRPAETSDANQINDIWNHYVENTIDVGYIKPWTKASWPSQIRQDTGIELPFLVAVLKSGKNTKRENNEHIVGFGRAITNSDGENAFRLTVEIEIYVRHQAVRKGVGKSIFDRLMAAIAGPPYFTKYCAPFITAGDDAKWDNGEFRRNHTIIVSVFHDGPEDPSLKWKRAFLEANDFQLSGCIPKYAVKFGKMYDMSQFYFHTNMVIPRHSLS